MHVADLAEAHVAAMSHLESTNGGHTRLNIGTGNGASVLDIVHGIEACAGKSVQQAHKILGWKSSRTLQDIIQSAWDAWPKR